MTPSANPIPHGMHTITPHLVCDGAAAAIEFYKEAFGARQLQPASNARTVRSRNGRAAVLDGPFAETKEMLAGFNLVEAGSMEEGVRMARELPWIKYGSVEVRPVGDIAAMRVRVGA